MIVTGAPRGGVPPSLLEEVADVLELPLPTPGPRWVLAKAGDPATWPPHRERIIMCARARGVSEDAVVTAHHVTVVPQGMRPYVALQGARLLHTWGHLADEDDAWSLHWQPWVPPF